MKGKKFITLLLSLAMMFSVAASINFLAFSEEKQKSAFTSISVNSASYSAGEQVRIPVYIKDNAGILGFMATFEYEPSYLTPVDVEYGDIISSGLENNIGGNSVDGEINVYYYGVNELTENGIIFYLVFDVNKNAVGTSRIGVSYSQEDTFNEDFQDVVLKCYGAEITIQNNASNYSKASLSLASLDNSNLVLNLELTDINSSVNVDIKYDSNAFSYVDSKTGFASDSNGVVTLNFNKSGSTNIIFDVNKEFENDLYVFELSSTDDNIICESIVVDVSILQKTTLYSNRFFANSGETIDIPISIKHNSGLMAYGLHFEYDSNAIEVMSATRGSSFSGNFTNNVGLNKGEFDVIWNDNDNVYANDTLLTLKVKALTNETKNTLISISYNQDDTFNENFDDVELICQPVEIYLNHEHSYSVVSTPALCEDGFKVYECKSCGEEYKEEVISEMGHYYIYVGEYESKSMKYHCDSCSKDIVVDNSFVKSYWNIDYLNKTSKRTKVDDSCFVDVVADGIINAKDYAAIKNISKIKE